MFVFACQHKIRMLKSGWTLSGNGAMLCHFGAAPFVPVVEGGQNTVMTWDDFVTVVTMGHGFCWSASSYCGVIAMYFFLLQKTQRYQYIYIYQRCWFMLILWNSAIIRLPGLPAYHMDLGQKAMKKPASKVALKPVAKNRRLWLEWAWILKQHKIAQMDPTCG